MQDSGKSNWLAALLIVLAAISQTGCLALAAGAAGGVVGHEIAEHEDEDDEDDE
jgi:hypothetical protein